MRLQAISSIDRTNFGKVYTDKAGSKYLNKKLGLKKAQEFKNNQTDNNVADIFINGNQVSVHCDGKKYQVKNNLIESRTDEIFYEDNRGSGMDFMLAFDGKSYFNVAPWHYQKVLESMSCGYKSAPVSIEGKRGVFISNTTEYPNDYGKGNEVFTNAELIATGCKKIANESSDKIYLHFPVEDDNFTTEGKIGSKIAKI